MNEPSIKKNARYDWDDFRTWPEESRWELIGGEVFDMNASPLTRHQIISGNLFGDLFPVFKKGPCTLFAAPMDVKLSNEDIVQPDLLVVCNPDQMKDTHIEGPPTLVVEIASPSTLRHDRVRKFSLYERCGVQEYWIVTPYPSLVEVFTLTDSGYRLHAGYEKEETLLSPAFPELKLPLEAIFDFPVDPHERVTMVKETTPPFATARVQ
jgi:Uma2 family endonuclease